LLPSAPRSKGRSPKSYRSVIVIVVEADTGAAGLAGLATDRQMPHYFDLDGDLAGRRRHTLTDPDGNSGGDVFPCAQRGPACAAAAARRPSRVQRAGRRPARGRAEFEPIRTETASQFIEHPGATARERGRGGGELHSFAGAELTDAAVEQHTRKDLVLRHGRRRTERHFWRRGNSADLNLRGNVGGARLGDDIENG